MNCIICNGSTKPGLKSVAMEREGRVLVVQKVPAEICTNCGEAYAGSDVTRKVLELANVACRSGVQVACLYPQVEYEKLY